MTRGLPKDRIAVAGLEIFIDEIERLRLENKDVQAKVKRIGKQLEKATARAEQKSLEFDQE